MAKLYVIGNGFDLAHGMRTSYHDFKEWLSGQGGQSSRSLLWVLDNLEMYCNIDDFWSSLEESLGKMDIRAYLREIMDEHSYNNPEDEHYGELGEGWDAAYAQLITIDKESGLDVVSDIFSRWIRKVPTANAVLPQYQALTDKDVYLSFNYTDTLETIYRIPSNRILHIHGLTSIQESELVFGHGHLYDLEQCERIGDEVMGIDAEGVAKMYGEALNKLYKHTQSIYESEIRWFDNLIIQGITDIVALGFSFGEVDDRYLNEIRNRLSNANWHFSIYTSNEEARKRDLDHVRKFINRIGLAPMQCHAFDAEDTSINLNI